MTSIPDLVPRSRVCHPCEDYTRPAEGSCLLSHMKPSYAGGVYRIFASLSGGHRIDPSLDLPSVECPYGSGLDWLFRLTSDPATTPTYAGSAFTLLASSLINRMMTRPPQDRQSAAAFFACYDLLWPRLRSLHGRELPAQVEFLRTVLEAAFFFYSHHSVGRLWKMYPGWATRVRTVEELLAKSHTSDTFCFVCAVGYSLSLHNVNNE